MAGLVGNRDLARKVLGDPSVFPDEFQSWIQRLIPGNPTIQLDHTQIPNPELIHIVGSSAKEPAFIHGAAYGSGFEVPSFYIDPWQRVHLRGLVGPTYAATQTIFQLPVSYRPTATLIFPSITDTGVGRVDVDNLGNVIFVSGGTGYVTLSGISFRAS